MFNRERWKINYILRDIKYFSKMTESVREYKSSLLSSSKANKGNQNRISYLTKKKQMFYIWD